MVKTILLIGLAFVILMLYSPFNRIWKDKEDKMILYSYLTILLLHLQLPVIMDSMLLPATLFFIGAASLSLLGKWNLAKYSLTASGILLFIGFLLT
ncbi:hypothetical protein K0H71_04695 [Bacillus sp. IITD106]|nr:hypothetical protein [Bacillus sp. IITD106]